MRARLEGLRAGGREAWVEGLAGAMRVAEVLPLAAAALGVPAAAEAALRVDARVLRGDETLAEAGVPREGGVIEVWVTVGEGGGGLLPTWHAPWWGYLGWTVGRRRAAVAESTGGPGNLVFGPGFRLQAQLGYPDQAPTPADGVSIFAPPAEEGLAGAVGGLLGELEGDVAVIKEAVARLNAADSPPEQAPAAAPARAQLIVLARA